MLRLKNTAAAANKEGRTMKKLAITESRKSTPKTKLTIQDSKTKKKFYSFKTQSASASLKSRTTNVEFHEKIGEKPNIFFFDRKRNNIKANKRS